MRVLLCVFLAAPAYAGTAFRPVESLPIPGALPAPPLAPLPAEGIAPLELPGLEPIREEAAAPSAPLAPAAQAREEYRAFLMKVGFQPYTERIAAARKSEELSPTQRKVLRRNEERLGVVDAARELAAKLMAGLAARGYSQDAMDRGVDMAVDLLAVNPLPPPELRRAPAGAAGDSRIMLDWLARETADRIGRQTAALASRLEAGEDAELKGYLETLLRTRYLDVELGQTRWAGRALAASLVRHARLHGRPEIERRLEEGLRSRGMNLSHFVGDRIELADSAGRTRALRVRTGDILGSRFRSRRASLIGFGGRPHWTLWLKALRQGLLANALGIWMKPADNVPARVPGQPLRNALRRWTHALRTRLAFSPWLLRGYGHVALASVEEADGVALAWAWESEVDPGQGGPRKVGLADEFLKAGHHARLGVGSWDAAAMQAEFKRQAAVRGYEEYPYSAKGGGFKSGISPEEFDYLLGIPEGEADEFLRALGRFAIRNVESLMADLGVAYDFGYFSRAYRANCAVMNWLGFRLAQFEIQSRRDHWNVWARILRGLGQAYSGGLEMQGRMIWPGGFFVDPKIARHEWLYLPEREEVYRDGDPYLANASGERDPAPGDIVDARRIYRQLRGNLTARRLRRRGSDWRNAFSLAVGYFAGLERLMRTVPVKSDTRS